MNSFNLPKSKLKLFKQSRRSSKSSVSSDDSPTMPSTPSFASLSISTTTKLLPELKSTMSNDYNASTDEYENDIDSCDVLSSVDMFIKSQCDYNATIYHDSLIPPLPTEDVSASQQVQPTAGRVLPEDNIDKLASNILNVVNHDTVEWGI